MTLEEEAVTLAKAVLLLDKYGYIQTYAYDDESEGQCAHFREIAMRAAGNIQKLANES